MLKKIKKYIHAYVVRIKTTITCIKETKPFMQKISKTAQPSCLLTNISIYGNIGDLAITIAQRQFLKDNNIIFLEVPITVAKWYKKILAKKIPKTVKICDAGGGNMGIKWFKGEKVRRENIKIFYNNEIIIFPQTIDYDDSNKGKEELEASKNIYGMKGKKLHIFAREKTSFTKMKEIYSKNEVQLTPDIVLYLNKQKNNIKRDGIVFAIRSDKEKKVTEEQMNKFIEIAKSIDSNVTITDTVIKGYVFKDERENIFEKKLQQFRKAKLVVTDRLHGMIFAAITGTPCIVFSNSNHKVKGVYEWIKNLDYIVYTEDYNNVKQIMEKLYNMDNKEYDNSNFIQEYDKIKRCLEEETND